MSVAQPLPIGLVSFSLETSALGFAKISCMACKSSGCIIWYADLMLGPLPIGRQSENKATFLFSGNLQVLVFALGWYVRGLDMPGADGGSRPAPQLQ